MASPREFSSDIAFSPAVQAKRGSRETYAKRPEWRTEITPDLAVFIGDQISVFLATASADGQPYIQHRGGPPGFLRVLNAKTIAFADFRGNRQYITTGNLSENPQAYLFLIDYANRRRIKLWGTARVIEDDEPLLKNLTPPDAKATVEQAIVFTVTAWDSNCPQHIPRRFEAADVTAAMESRDKRIADLEAEVARLHSGKS
jgi:uncharacterized protein